MTLPWGTAIGVTWFIMRSTTWCEFAWSSFISRGSCYVDKWPIRWIKQKRWIGLKHAWSIWSIRPPIDQGCPLDVLHRSSLVCFSSILWIEKRYWRSMESCRYHNMHVSNWSIAVTLHIIHADAFRWSQSWFLEMVIGMSPNGFYCVIIEANWDCGSPSHFTMTK
jgi:hypothetical protein